MGPDPGQLPSLAGSDWLTSPALQSVFSLLGGSEEVRVVGGAVRDALLGEKVSDIDLACVHSADEIMRRAQNAGIEAVATGGKHGTVSLIVKKENQTCVYEVTPLRVDVATDGRHAVVAPTQDWEQDARRRDFSINALYCDERGHVYDIIGGYADILTRRVRFIGSARQRIEEDYLRILRFFRFSAYYANGIVDAGGLAACIACKEGLSRLSAERIKQEMFKLLVAPFAGNVIAGMIETQILEACLPGPVQLASFTAVVAIERELTWRACAVRRLAALAGGDNGQMELWAEYLKLSNRERAFLADAGSHVAEFSSALSGGEQKVLLYRLGEETFTNCAVLAWALEGKNADAQAWKNLIELPRRWPVPAFALRGADVLALGVAAGPKVGDILSRLEQDWIDAGFEWDAAELEARLKMIVRKP